MTEKRLGRICTVAAILSMTILGAAVAARAQTVNTIDPALKGQIDRIANQVLEERGVPSASVAVVKGGKLVYTHAYGLAHLIRRCRLRRRCATPLDRYRSSLRRRRF